MSIDECVQYDIHPKYLYNEEIKQKVYNYYINDFIFFHENGIDYMDTSSIGI